MFKVRMPEVYNVNPPQLFTGFSAQSEILSNDSNLICCPTI